MHAGQRARECFPFEESWANGTVRRALRSVLGTASWHKSGKWWQRAGTGGYRAAESPEQCSLGMLRELGQGERTSTAPSTGAALGRASPPAVREPYPGQGLRESGGSGRAQGSRGGHGPRP